MASGAGTFLGRGAGQPPLQLLPEAVVGLDGVLQSLPQTPDLSQVLLHQVWAYNTDADHL